MIGPARLAEEEDRILACIHCGFCLPACPTYQVLGSEADSPRGRISLIRALAEGRIAPDDEALYTHLDRCLGCLACETACPSGVEYGVLLERAREVQKAERGLDLPTRILLAGFGRRGTTKIIGALGRKIRQLSAARFLLRAIPKWLPRIRFGFAILLSTERWSGLEEIDIRAGRDRSQRKKPERDEKPTRVAVTKGCVQDAPLQRINQATQLVLETNGYTVIELEGAHCCGALHLHAGEMERATDFAKAYIVAFEESGAEYLISDSGGCGAHLKKYGPLLEREKEWRGRSVAMSKRVRDLFEFLAEEGVAQGVPLDLKVTYDAPCHLYHGQGIRVEPERMIEEVAGVEVIPLIGKEECCGGAGVYGVTHREIAEEILAKKIRAISDSGAEVVLTANSGCMMQIGAGLMIDGILLPVLHPVELMAESYRRLRTDHL